MNVDRLFKTESGKIILSVILGLGIAGLFRRACTNSKCVKYVFPKSQELEDQVFRYNDKCYKLKKVSEKCQENKKHVMIA